MARSTMQTMVLNYPGTPLVNRNVPVRAPAPGQVRIEVKACGVCRTDLHLYKGELPNPKQPVTPGHEIVGRIDALGEGVDRFKVGDRVGVPWLAATCGTCEDCTSGRENLCAAARFTGYTVNGGFAEFALAEAAYVLPLADGLSDAEAAPLLCAGLIGWRALKRAGAGKRLGLYGFGAAAHIIAQVARHQGREVYAFTRAGDTAAQGFARDLGAAWTGGSDEAAPETLDAAIIFAPDGALVPVALKAVRPGGRVVCAGIHMSDIPSFPYALLWGERELVSVANLTRADGEEFLALAPKIPVRTTVQPYRLADANQALEDLREGRVQGAAVLVMNGAGPDSA